MHVFACQHGVEECVNNLFQACLFNKVADTKLQVLLASCLMGSEDPHMKTKECMKKFNGKVSDHFINHLKDLDFHDSSRFEITFVVPLGSHCQETPHS